MLTRKSIDIISPADGRRYESVTEYEKSVDKAGKYILTDREYKEMREKCYDERSTTQKTNPDSHNHVHIDFANGRVIKSRKDLNV